MWSVFLVLLCLEYIEYSWSSIFLILLLCFSLFLSCRRGRGKYDFFAGCVSEIHPFPTPLEIAFGRPVVARFRKIFAGLSRPLIRGESKYIVVARATLICLLCCAIPGFAAYTVILVPTTAQATTRSIRTSQSWWWSGDVDEWMQANITIVMLYDSLPMGPIYANEEDPSSLDLITANVTVKTAGHVCGTTAVTPVLWWGDVTITCPFSWTDLPPAGLTLSANFSDPWGVLYVKPGQADPSDVDEYTEPIPLVAGSRLAAILGITQRRVLSRSGLDFSGLFGIRDVIVKPVLLIQEDPVHNGSSSHTVQLRLRSRRDILIPTAIVEDYTDASVLAGLASLGGFWAFINGAIALFFGADLLYFVFRMRPLSPLGLVHQLQRGSLIRKWNEDFPTMHTEGGRPGSDAAGVVAFIRERLVDLDAPSLQDPETQKPVIGETVSPEQRCGVVDSEKSAELRNDEINHHLSHEDVGTALTLVPKENTASDEELPESSSRMGADRSTDVEGSIVTVG
ncbi:hypothetical protein C8R43DRAFT_961702 [Mycena crocata]|nr:hypothetical protein C8R43DRAFT_961702 [Mycena crocata]